MATKREEVVVDPHTLQPKHLRKQTAQDLLLRRARRPPHRAHRLLRRRQRATVELAVGRQRKPIQHHKRRWHHVLGKALPQMRTQHRRIRNRIPRRNHIANQTLAPGAVLARDHRSLRNRPMPNQRRLDLPRLDPEAAHLHLRIRAPQELQHPVAAPARKVAGAVHPAPRSTKRVRNKPLRRQTRTANIPTRQARPRNVKLTAHTSRHRLQTTVQNVDLRVPDRDGRSEGRSRPPAAATRSWSRSTVVSVGPYALIMRDGHRDQRATRSRRHSDFAGNDQGLQRTRRSGRSRVSSIERRGVCMRDTLLAHAMRKSVSRSGQAADGKDERQTPPCKSASRSPRRQHRSFENANCRSRHRGPK